MQHRPALQHSKQGARAGEGVNELWHRAVAWRQLVLSQLIHALHAEIHNLGTEDVWIGAAGAAEPARVMSIHSPATHEHEAILALALNVTSATGVCFAGARSGSMHLDAIIWSLKVLGRCHIQGLIQRCSLAQYPAHLHV